MVQRSSFFSCVGVEMQVRGYRTVSPPPSGSAAADVELRAQNRFDLKLALLKLLKHTDGSFVLGFFKSICFGGFCSPIFFIQDVHVHLPGWTGGPDAVWNLPGSGVTDGTICQKLAVISFLIYCGIRSTKHFAATIGTNKCDTLLSLTLLLCRRRGCQWKLKRAPAAWATWTSAGSLRRLSTSWVGLPTQKENGLRSNIATWSKSSWISCQCNPLFSDKASPRASPRKRANRAAGADQ